MIIDRLWREQGGDYFFLASKSASGKFREHAFKRSEIKNVGQFCQENSDKDIYFCPHGFTKECVGADGPRRQKEYAVLPKMLWADLDEVDPRTINPKPTIAIESSPGRFVGLWFTDKVVTETLNRQLTYHLGADHGGWDLTQVLRVPGTTNYKYNNTPRVRLMWDDGPSWPIKVIRDVVPDEPEVDANLTANEVFDRYEKMLPAWVRRELMTAKLPAGGKRSEMIWKLEHALLEAGLSKDEAFVLIKSSVWNKFRGRNSEDKQLQRELDKVVKERMKAGISSAKDQALKYKYLAHSMAEVVVRNIDWIMYPILARGEVTIIEGDPGGGKSYLTQMIARGICDGEQLPEFIKGTSVKPIMGKVAYFDMENSEDTVTKKRLINNKMKNFENYIQESAPFSWADTERMQHVYEALERIKPTLVVFDTMNTYLGGKVDTNQANSSQEAMFPLKEIATRFDCAVAVIRHLVKSKKDKSALHAGQGSIAFAGFVRIVATVGKLPDDPDVGAIAVTKCNLAPMPKDALTFEILSLPDTKDEKDRSRFKWSGLVKNISSDDIIKTPEKNSDKEEAETFLQEVLDDGPEDFKKLEVMAEKRGINRRTLQRAADSLGVTREGKGFGKDKITYWSI